MKIICEVSRPHFHPSKDTQFPLGVTKKRDLSVPPNWVANERIIKDEVSYAVVMPPREAELFEIEQEVHIHLPEYLIVEVDGKLVKAKVKVSPYQFQPVVHFDEKTADLIGITNGQEGSV